MRLVFWLFLLLNASFFYWQYSQPQKPEPQLVQLEALPAGAERLVLLRERGLGAQKPTNPPGELTVLESISKPSASVDVMPEQDDLLQGTQAGKSPAGKGQDIRPEFKAESLDTPAVEKAPPVVMACFTLGPFKNEAVAGQMYKALLPLDIIVEQRLSEHRIPKNYWV